VRDDGSGCDDAAAADVGQDHRVAGNPGAGADANEAKAARLFANRYGWIISVRVRPARDVNTGGEQYVRFQVDETQMTAGSDVDVVVDSGAPLGQQRAEADYCRRRTMGDRPGEKRPSKILPNEAGHETERFA
jgi:hypothetical protein